MQTEKRRPLTIKGQQQQQRRKEGESGVIEMPVSTTTSVSSLSEHLKWKEHNKWPLVEVKAASTCWLCASRSLHDTWSLRGNHLTCSAKYWNRSSDSHACSFSWSGAGDWTRIGRRWNRNILSTDGDGDGRPQQPEKQNATVWKEEKVNAPSWPSASLVYRTKLKTSKNRKRATATKISDNTIWMFQKCSPLTSDCCR